MTPVNANCEQSTSLQLSTKWSDCAPANIWLICSPMSSGVPRQIKEKLGDVHSLSDQDGSSSTPSSAHFQSAVG